MNEAREGATRKERPEDAGGEEPSARDLAMAPEMLMPEALRVERPREETGERRRGGVAEEERERHSRAGVWVDHARGVAHAEHVSRESAVLAEKDRLGDVRGPGDCRQAFEIPRESGALSGEALEETVQIVVGLVHDLAGRQRGEVDETSFDA